MLIDGTIAALFALGFAAGALNAVAGGGPIIVVAALAALGVRADIANLTSTVALLPGQMAAGWMARASLVALGPAGERRWLIAIGLAGGAAGALLLLVTPARLFAFLLPWLILFATTLYAISSWPRARPAASGRAGGGRAAFAGLAVYGGFYGGGNSFMVLALLARRGLDARAAGHAKNLLILLVNLSAAGVFLVSGAVAERIAWPLGAGALAGSIAGVRLIDRIAPARLRLVVILCGGGLALWLLLRTLGPG